MFRWIHDCSGSYLIRYYFVKNSLVKYTSQNSNPNKYNGINSDYADWGFIEHGIGSFQHEVILLLKRCNSEYIDEYLRIIESKIEEIGFVQDYEKDDLLLWLRKKN